MQDNKIPMHFQKGYIKTRMHAGLYEYKKDAQRHSFERLFQLDKL